MNLRELYQQTPMPVKKLFFKLCPYPIVAGQNYRKTLALCHKLDEASAAEVRMFQERKLKELLTYAVHHVRFYKPYRGIVEQNESAIEALRHFPLLEKSDIQQHYSELVSDQIERIPHLRARTGGSSGNQLIFLQDKKIYAIEMGFMHFQWQRVGYWPCCRKATFRGVTFTALDRQKFWQENPVHNELQFSPFHMTKEHLPAYVRKLREYAPQFLHGYPSALCTLAEYVIEQGLSETFPEIRAALCGSEPCLDFQRKKITAAFGCPVLSWYGHSERVILGGERQHYHGCQMLPGYGFLEILDSNGNVCANGESGELVGTGFWNYSMPLIRYRTDDYAIRDYSREDESHVAGGGKWFHDISGRRNNSFLVGKSGILISAAAINIHEDIFDRVEAFQYYQCTEGKMTIRIIPGHGFSRKDEEAILAVHQAKAQGELELNVEICSEIAHASSGKRLTIAVTDSIKRKINHATTHAKA